MPVTELSVSTGESLKIRVSSQYYSRDQCNIREKEREKEKERERERKKGRGERKK